MIVPGRNVSSVNGLTNFVDGKFYHFYDRMKTRELPGHYQSLLKGAKQSIVIWDPHYRQCDCSVFSEIEQDGIYMEILTVCECSENKDDMDAFASKVLNSIDKTDVPNCKIRVYSLVPYDIRRKRGVEWHDRFLIIDNKDVYLVGASLDSHEKSKRSYGIYLLTETEDKNLVIDAYKAYRDDITDISGGARGNGYISYVHRP